MMDKQIEKLEQKGSIFTTKEKEKLKSLYNKTTNEIIEKLSKTIEKYKNNKNFGIKNISVGIKVGDLEKVIEIKETKGNLIYDLASITKFFTLKLCYELKKEGIIDFNSLVKDILPLENIEGCRIIDIIKMSNSLETKGRLAETTDEQSYLRRLYTINYKITNTSTYTDVGHALLTKVIEKAHFNQTKEDLSYIDIFKKYIKVPLQLESTCYLPDQTKYTPVGNGSNTNLPHDPKTKIAVGISGAAGIFSQSKDFFKIAEELNNNTFFNHSFKKDFFAYNFLDEKERKRTYSGLYLKTPHNKSSYIPDTFSNNSIAHQGYTGSIIVFDMENKIHFSLLVDAINHKTNLKTEDYFEHFHELKKEIGLYCIAIYMSTND